jgi:anti-sigma B factor antagonist
MSHQGFCTSQPAGDQSEVLMLDGDFDRSNAPQVEEAFDVALHAGRPQLILDLRGVSSVDSTILRVLIRSLNDALAEDSRLALIRPNATVWRVFVLTGLSQTLPAFGRLDEAMASFGVRA